MRYMIRCCVFYKILSCNLFLERSDRGWNIRHRTRCSRLLGNMERSREKKSVYEERGKQKYRGTDSTRDQILLWLESNESILGARAKVSEIWSSLFLLSLSLSLSSTRHFVPLIIHTCTGVHSTICKIPDN